MMSLKVKCEFCHCLFFKELKRINEAKKYGWKQYCSVKCLNEAKNRQILFKCANPKCGRYFRNRIYKTKFLKSRYCSSSCAAKVNNVLFPKKTAKINICGVCHDKFKGMNKFCSRKCSNLERTITQNKIIEEINDFYLKQGRIPLKMEFKSAKAARLRFGSWNKAIIEAGFSPNPVKYANKQLAIDGHLCDSVAELIIDNWLYRNKINHQVHVLYPNSKMSVDFFINGIRIEYIGLEGVNKRYDLLLKQKRGLIKKNNYQVIFISPKDLIPINKLDKILTDYFKKVGYNK